VTKNHKRIIIIVAVALVGIVIAYKWSQPKPIKVIVKAVERGMVESTVANTRAGTVKACRRAGLSPAMGGQIAQLPVKKGDKVQAGELLLALWNDDLQAQVTLSEQQYHATKARAESSCIQADIARRESQRLQKLKASGAASAEQIDQATSRAQSSRADCASAKAEANVSRAQMDVAGANLARTLLIAPFDGVVAEINGELNEYVTPSPPGIPTLPAIDLVDNSCFYVTAPIDEVDAPGVEVGMPARISMDAFGKERFPGKVKRIADYVLDREKQARTVDIEVSFSDPSKQPKLLAGYSADAEIILSSHQDVLRIPTIAVMEGPKVTLLDGDTLQLRDIKTGISNWDYTEVLEGLEAGDQVVTSLDRPGVEEGANAVAE
jgi:HlyD family secretion protein